MTSCGIYGFKFFCGKFRGVLMDDAMILPCGHSFGGGGIQHVIRMVSFSETMSFFGDSV